MISNFQELLDMANEQTDAQRLLFLFAQTDVSKKTRKSDEKRGTLEPLMCVDKLPSEVESFTSLSLEADKVSKDWDMVFISALAGTAEKAPTTEEAEPFLNQMTNDLTSGQNIGRYVIFDRKENPISLQAN